MLLKVEKLSNADANGRTLRIDNSSLNPVTQSQLILNKDPSNEESEEFTMCIPEQADASPDPLALVKTDEDSPQGL